MFKKWQIGYIACCILAMIVTITAHVNAYKKFGRDCRDISCVPPERCILSSVACEKDQLDGEHCGQYPKCVEHSSSSDQHLNRITIDTTSTTANTRSISAPNPGPSTSTLHLNHQLYPESIPDRDNGFELLNGATGPVPGASHADQRQANVLVIVQDGAQQPMPNPNPNLNYNRQLWRQPCIVSPYYPYACTNGASPYVPPSPYLPATRSVPPYSSTRTAAGPQLVPPTPPCYVNCYPRLATGYPLARSSRPTASTSNYLFYITI
ncbi:uncharacterized protein LOC111597322 [Drosophila hydei]|uniref:Uncharacterized protein LOC111597322 n=1 Tax=Drosophila hydei TaxID=7224 RepID=A0A6J1LM58_DROHY|nr:uncharacterized protein LOC111597322 [Drosophila hydei]